METVIAVRRIVGLPCETDPGAGPRDPRGLNQPAGPVVAIRPGRRLGEPRRLPTGESRRPAT